jgi:hypothetical protein
MNSRRSRSVSGLKLAGALTASSIDNTHFGTKARTAQPGCSPSQ